eukprot:CAMPEP_0170372456 /NCGR_PEP_ID=MMETSP0117_2-20130122/9564_1 /TAXON_ID=400756 /ORGANISM="Durinskia baltica, Strain CSIRO CS-38" /LENGTH=40 /DNA_ID= /DNA_START= /DNA_END= /DNA_ORIENTATION=
MSSMCISCHLGPAVHEIEATGAASLAFGSAARRKGDLSQN